MRGRDSIRGRPLLSLCVSIILMQPPSFFTTSLTLFRAFSLFFFFFSFVPIPISPSSFRSLSLSPTRAPPPLLLIVDPAGQPATNSSYTGERASLPPPSPRPPSPSPSPVSFSSLTSFRGHRRRRRRRLSRAKEENKKKKKAKAGLSLSSSSSVLPLLLLLSTYPFFLCSSSFRGRQVAPLSLPLSD